MARSEYFGRKTTAFGRLARSFLRGYNDGPGSKRAARQAALQVFAGTFDGVIVRSLNKTAPKSEAAERAQHDFIATIEKECPRALGASAVGSELPDMTYLRAMLDLDWWRRPNARAVETFYAGLARGCAVPGYQRVPVRM